MKTIRIREESEDRTVDFTLEVPDENPYDEGYLLTPEQVLTIATAWQGRPAEEDVVRHLDEAPDGTLAIVLLLEGEITVDWWESTTDYHDWDEGKQSRRAMFGDGSQAFSTSMWPFTGTLVAEEVE